MTDLSILAKTFTKFIKVNATTILTVTAVAGVVGSVATTFHEAPKAKAILDDIREDLKDESASKKDIIFKGAKQLAPVLLPIVLTSTLSIASVIGLNSVHTKRYAAVSAAYAIADRSLKEWKEHTEEIVGKKKVDDIKMAIADEKAKDVDMSKGAIIPPDPQPGSSALERLDICIDANTGTQFYTNASRIREAFTKLQTTLNGCDWVSVNDLYHELGIRKIKFGEDLGWNMGEDIDYDITYSRTADDNACIVLTYTPGPRKDLYGDFYGHNH